MVTARVRADTALAIVEHLSVAAKVRRVLLEPADALLAGGRVNDLELTLRAVQLTTTDGVRDEAFDCKRARSQSVPCFLST